MEEHQQGDDYNDDLGDVGDVLLEELSAVRSRRGLADISGESPKTREEKLTLYYRHAPSVARRYTNRRPRKPEPPNTTTVAIIRSGTLGLMLERSNSLRYNKSAPN
jgi:hypothetical protein